jgi:hypothetical protein
MSGDARILELMAPALQKTPILGLGSQTHVLLARLLKGLRKQFPYNTFRVDIEQEKCVFGRGGDSKMVDLMRAFCAGFVASL